MNTLMMSLLHYVINVLSFAQDYLWAPCSCNLALVRRAGSIHGGFAAGSGKPSSFHAVSRPRDSVCLVLGASPCKMLRSILYTLARPVFSLFSLRYNDVRLFVAPSCLLLDARPTSYQL